MKTNSSYYINNRIFIPLDKDRLVHLTTLFLIIPNVIKYHYKIYDIKFLDIIKYFE